MTLNQIKYLCGAAIFVIPMLGHGVSFGIFDPRTQALGGTSVAMGDLGLGHLYNPALTALHRGDEDDTKDGRHSLPAVISYSQAAEVAYTAVRDDIESQLSDAIDQFNANPGQQTAINGVLAATDLKNSNGQIWEMGNIFADMYAGYSVSEPGEREGGAFFIGTRIIGNGVAAIEDSDLDLIDDYIEALRFINTGGVSGVPHPELFLADGQLADPADDILSSAKARIGILTEMGLSGAKMVELWGQAFSFGIAPKATNIILYDDTWRVEGGDFISDGEDQSHWYFNMDLGMIWAPGDAWRVGLSTKDILTHNYKSALGYHFALKPRTRLGVAYEYNNLKVGMDLDVIANNTFAANQKQQDITFGIEYTVKNNLQLRAGYYHDIEQTYKDKASFGIGYRWRSVILDFAYASGSSDSSLGIQISFAH